MVSPVNINCIYGPRHEDSVSGNGRFQEQNFEFYLTPGQSSDISNSSYRNDLGRPDYRTQLLMRFSLLETSCEQEDNFPSSICVKVNQRLCPLPNPIPTNKPGAEPKVFQYNLSRSTIPLQLTPKSSVSVLCNKYCYISAPPASYKYHCAVQAVGHNIQHY